MRTQCILLGIVFLCFAACAGPSVEQRLSTLETGRATDDRLLSMRLDGMEKRLTALEGDMGALRDNLPHSGAGNIRAPVGKKRGQAALRPPAAQAPDQQHSSVAPAAPAPASQRGSGAPAPVAVPAPEPASVPAPPPAPATNLADRDDIASRDNVPSLVPLDLLASQERATAPAAARTPAPAAPSSPASTVPAAAPPAPAAGPARSPDASGSRAAYDAALALYNKNNYTQAAAAFSAFLRDYPRSPLAPNAGYWLGECGYSTGKYGDAVIAFKDVASKYPGHPKAAAALLKAGYAYERMRDTANAHFYWQLLLDDYPSSGPAALARKRMSVR